MAATPMGMPVSATRPVVSTSYGATPTSARIVTATPTPTSTSPRASVPSRRATGESAVAASGMAGRRYRPAGCRRTRLPGAVDLLHHPLQRHAAAWAIGGAMLWHAAAMEAFVAAGAGFLLAVLWFDLMHDVQVRGHDPSADLPGAGARVDRRLLRPGDHGGPPHEPPDRR